MALGLLAGAFIGFLWLVFGAAAAGNSGTTSTFSNAFLPVSLGVFGLYAAVTIGLYVARRDTLAVVAAWLPVALIFFGIPMLRDIAHWFGAR